MFNYIFGIDTNPSSSVLVCGGGSRIAVFSSCGMECWNNQCSARGIYACKCAGHSQERDILALVTLPDDLYTTLWTDTVPLLDQIIQC